MSIGGAARTAGAIALAATAGVVANPAGAGAAREHAASGGDYLRFTAAPLVSDSTPRAGMTVSATGVRWEGDASSVVYQWLRCSGTDLGDCRLIGGANRSGYTVSDGDVGFRLRVGMALYGSGRGSEYPRDYAVSDPTAAVAAKPVPTPTPTPSATPVAPAPPQPAPVPPVEQAAPVVAPAAAAPPTTTHGAVKGANTKHAKRHAHTHHAKRKLRRLRPFPVVRISGWLTSSGARVSVLTVRAPRHAHIRLRCSGPSCPSRALAHSVALVHMYPFERRVLRAGTRITISVTRKGYIGKYTRIVVRRGHAPARVDRCLFPGRAHPRRCG